MFQNIMVVCSWELDKQQLKLVCMVCVDICKVIRVLARSSSLKTLEYNRGNVEKMLEYFLLFSSFQNKMLLP